MSNMVRNIKGGKIGYDVPVKNPVEARMFMALSVAASTWNTFVGPFGDGLENKGFLSWLPQGLPPDLTATPLPLADTAEVTKKIKIMAAYAGADKAGVTAIDRRWVYAASCRNLKEPGPAQTKPIVFQNVDQPMETDRELVLPDSVRYAVVMLFVMPRALNQIGPSTLATATSAGQGYAQMGLAAVALAHGLRRDGWDHGIRATALCPGLVSTDMGVALFPDKASDMTHPEDVARMAALALDLPNSASVAEMHVNCANGEIF